jgi:hypothetical protein
MLDRITDAVERRTCRHRSLLVDVVLEIFAASGTLDQINAAVVGQTLVGSSRLLLACRPLPLAELMLKSVG